MVNWPMQFRPGKAVTLRRVMAACAVLALVILAGCVRVPAGEPDMRGEITSIGRAVGSPAVLVLVETHPGQDDGSDKAYVSVSNDRAVARRQNGSHRRAATDDLEEGQWVEVWFDGPVAESYPVQGKARMIVIVPEP